MKNSNVTTAPVTTAPKGDKAKKVNFKCEANKAWKSEVFKLSGIIKYIQKSREKNMLEFLKELDIKTVDVNIKMIKDGAKPEKFFTYNKDGEPTGDKVYFSLWFALTAIKSNVTEARKAKK